MKQLIFAGFMLAVLAYKPKMPSSLFINNLSFYAVAKYDTATIEGSWKLLPVLASDTAAGKIPEINFNLKTNKFSGNTGCNTISGTFILKQDALSFDENIISTKMACPGYNEKAFFDNLLRTNRYEIKNGVLQLMYNTTVLSQWVRHTSNTVIKQI
jgi:heat shock protein HslJ